MARVAYVVAAAVAMLLLLLACATPSSAAAVRARGAGEAVMDADILAELSTDSFLDADAEAEAEEAATDDALLEERIEAAVQRRREQIAQRTAEENEFSADDMNADQEALVEQSADEWMQTEEEGGLEDTQSADADVDEVPAEAEHSLLQQDSEATEAAEAAMPSLPEPTNPRVLAKLRSSAEIQEPSLPEPTNPRVLAQLQSTAEAQEPSVPEPTDPHALAQMNSKAAVTEPSTKTENPRPANAAPATKPDAQADAKAEEFVPDAPDTPAAPKPAPAESEPKETPATETPAAATVTPPAAPKLEFYPDAPSFVPDSPHDHFWLYADTDPQQARAKRVLDKQFRTPEFYPERSSTGFTCRNAASRPIQAPVFTASYAPTPKYSCEVSPFVSKQSWVTCNQQHQACYLSCQATQARCDNEFLHCIIKACGTGEATTECGATKSSCKDNLKPLLQSRFFNNTSYGTCQSHACMCVSTAPAESGTTSPQSPVQPPSALESWPFYVAEVPDERMSLLETASAQAEGDVKSLFDALDAHDFVPDVAALNKAVGRGSDLRVKVGDREDVRAMSTATQVIGADYTSAADVTTGSSHVRAGLVVAKGRRTLEHYIPTCARLAGGRLLGIFQSHVGGSAAQGVPSHRLLMGVTQQGEGRGLIMSTSLLVQLFADRIEVSNAWTPSLQRVNPAALGVVTLQVWASVWEQDLFYSLILATLERIGQAQVPVLYHTLNHAPVSDSDAMPVDPALLEMDPYVSAAQALLHTHATTSTGFWIESVQFQFPANVLLTLKSTSPATQHLSLEVRSWSEAHAHANTSTILPVQMAEFRADSQHPTKDDDGGEMFLGSLRVYTLRMDITMSDTIDSVFILTNLPRASPSGQLPDLTSDERDAMMQTADQVFTNLGYFFFFQAGTEEAHKSRSRWEAGVPMTGAHGAIPSLLPSTGQIPARAARIARAALPPAHIPLPGSGILSVSRESMRATGVVGVSRSLTPLSWGVDLSGAFWGVSVMLRLLPSSLGPTVPLAVYLQLESPTVKDYAFHKSPRIVLREAGCWMHAQFAFDEFLSDVAGRPLPLHALSKVTLVAEVRAVRGHALESEAATVSRVEVGAFTLQVAPFPDAERRAAARCSPPQGALQHDMHTRRHALMQLIDDTFLTRRGAASTSAAASLLLALAAAAWAAVAAARI